MKTFLSLPSQEELHELFEYKEGNLYWKIKFARKINIGSKVGCLSGNGYILLKINKVNYRMHRIIWAYHYNAIPNNFEIDHIDGNRTNNRIENLRLATRSQNQCNHKRAQRNSKSNILGIFWHKESSKWRAYIRKNNKSIHLGCFVSQEDAIAARKAAELQYFVEFAP